MGREMRSGSLPFSRIRSGVITSRACIEWKTAAVELRFTETNVRLEEVVDHIISKPDPLESLQQGLDETTNNETICGDRCLRYLCPIWRVSKFSETCWSRFVNLVQYVSVVIISYGSMLGQSLLFRADKLCLVFRCQIIVELKQLKRPVLPRSFHCQV